MQDSDRAGSALNQFRGQVVVLSLGDLLACVEEMPSLVEMQRRMKAKGVTVLAVSIDVDELAYHRFLNDYGVNMLTVRDSAQKSSIFKYGTFKFPETYVIDRNGVMRRKFIGAVIEKRRRSWISWERCEDDLPTFTYVNLYAGCRWSAL